LVGTLTRRVEQLETTYGDNPCKRCNNTTIVIDTAGVIRVIRHQSTLTGEAAERFYKEELPDDRCPVCGNIRQRVRVTWGNLH